MCAKKNKCQASHRSHKTKYLMDRSIGDLFRIHGEDYIKIYKPPLQHIKIIRAIRVCRSPALGGKTVTCTSCAHTKYIYHSCGNTHCPLCQNRKRQLWQERLADKFLAVPYAHIVFTIPHDLNTLARNNPRLIYNITMRAAWKSIKNLTAEKENVGGLPGMVAVLHTFGSDMRYHIHVHTLVTFGGLDEAGNWKWPKKRKKIASFRKISKEYRDTFIKMLRKNVSKNLINKKENIEELISTIAKKRWNVRNEYPTADTEVLQRYLARYINRIAISKSRLEYIAQQQKIKSKVCITYKDYRQQINGQPAPLASKNIEPLVAINQFLMHVLPPYFQKARYYGIHAPPTFKRLKKKIPQKLIRNNRTIRVVFIVINTLLGLTPYSCEICEGQEFVFGVLKPDINWTFQFITIPSYRGPPKTVPSNVI